METGNEIFIGFESEQNSRETLIELRERSMWPEAFVSLVVIRPGETEPYLAAGVSANGKALRWTPNGYDTQKRGIGKAQILYTEDRAGTIILGKSPVYKVIIGESIPGTDEAEIPDPYESWVATITGIAAEAYQHEQGALAAQEAAETAQGKAEDAQEAAETAQGKAEDAQTAAETAQGKAEDAQTAAETAQGKAKDAQTAAETAQGKAETAQGKAEDAQTAAETAQGKAEDAQTAAEGSASSAAGSAQDAAGSAQAASGSATAAGNAKTAAETAQGKAETAQGKAEDAQAAAETAQGKAEDAQEDAEGSATAAAGSAQAAAASAASISTAQAEASTLQPDSPATAEIVPIQNGLKFVFGIPKGTPGNDDIDDTAGAGVTDKVWSANKLATEFGNIESALNKIGLTIYNGQFYIAPVESI